MVDNFVSERNDVKVNRQICRADDFDENGVLFVMRSDVIAELLISKWIFWDLSESMMKIFTFQ